MKNNPLFGLRHPKGSILAWVLGLVLFVALGTGSYYLFYRRDKANTPPPPTVSIPTPNPSEALASSFATYAETPVNVTPKVPAYSVKPDLGNVTNAADLNSLPPLSPEGKARLAQDGFVAQQSPIEEFFSIYEGNRYAYIPNFVTTDSMLHNYHLMFDHLLRKIEEEKLIGLLKELNASLLAEAGRQLEALKGTDWENAAQRNLGFFAVGSKLLDPSVQVPAAVQSAVSQELALIEAHATIKESPVMNVGSKPGVILDTPQGPLSVDELKEDYSQYVPRGHYTKSEALKAYFKSMMWYGRLTFRLKNEDEIRSALLITLALGQGDNEERWSKIYEPINFLVGKSDDITYYQFKEVAERAYGRDATPQMLASNSDSFTTFVAFAKTFEPPQLNSIPIFSQNIQPDRTQETKGFRFMGQRFTIDASIFQRLIEREVEQRFLPKGLDIPAALGSAEALNLLDQMGETKFKNYPENMSKMKTYLAGLPTETWTQNLYWGWLYALRPLLTEKAQGYPAFMQTLAWTHKELNTFLGSWTELKHDTILYAKQVYAEMGGGGEEPKAKDDRGYVEPNPWVYGRLVSLLKMTSEGLETRGLLGAPMKKNLDTMATLALSLKTISEKELNNEKLSDSEYELIRSYGGQLEHFWLEVNQEDMAKQNLPQRDFLDQNPAALVADVATDPSGQVLEEATGHISNLYVIVPVEGQLRLARGGIYSYYEFPQPLSERLTDEQWREKLDSRQAPEPPSWTKSFMTPQTLQ